jgi:hypothetical protein
LFPCSGELNYSLAGWFAICGEVGNKWKMVLVSEVWEFFTMVEVVLLSVLTLILNLGGVLPAFLLSSFSAFFIRVLVNVKPAFWCPVTRPGWELLFT